MPASFIVKTTRGLSLRSTNKANFWSLLVHRVMMRKADNIWSHVGVNITGKKILDVGMGSGSIAYFLNKKKFTVTSIDVKDMSIYTNLKPVIYDGQIFPFKDQTFDTAIIIHVLHHCSDGIKVLREAKRVAKRVVVVEDTFRNKAEWLVVAVCDAVTNVELWWHKYRKTAEWKKIIKSNGWELVSYDEWSEAGITSPYGRYCKLVIE